MCTNRPRLGSVRSALPDPTSVPVGDGAELETLHVPGDGPTLVFVHGGLGSLWNHYLQFDHFRRDRELVAYSLSGYGQSSPPRSRSLSTHVDDLRRLLARLGTDETVLVGWSYGAAVALEYAMERPVDGLVLCNGADHALTPWWEPPMVKAALALRLYRLFRGERLPKSFARSVIFHDSTPDSAVEKFLETIPTPLPRSAWEVLESFWGYDRSDRTHDVDAPTLVVHGPADRLVPAEAARQTASRVPDAVFRSLERSGHAVMFERPKRYNRLVELVVEAAAGGGELDSLVGDRFDAPDVAGT